MIHGWRTVIRWPTDSAEDRVHVPVAFTRDHSDWLTADGQANFARGTEASVTQSQADANAAMVMHDTLCSPLGLDSAHQCKSAHTP